MSPHCDRLVLLYDFVQLMSTMPRNFVRNVGDDAVLSRILGAEFVSVAGALGLRTVPSPSSVPSAGLSRQPPTLPVTKKLPSTSGNQETKRPKLDDDVIDLPALP